jgi:hypothetical protein
MMNAIRWAMATMVLCAMAFASTTLLGEDNTAREARDRAEIEGLMWRYTRALDSGDGAAYAAAYTTDGQFGAGSTVTKGRDALSKLVVQRPAAGAPARPPLYHMELNHWIEFVDKDHVRYHAYYLTVSGAQGQETPARIVAAGQSLDTMERVSGKWLIKMRDVSAKD